MSETPGEVLEEAVEGSAPEPEPVPVPAVEHAEPLRRVPKPARVRLYRAEDGYRFVGVSKAGKTIEDTESNFAYLTVQHAKQAAHAAHPTLSIR